MKIAIVTDSLTHLTTSDLERYPYVLLWIFKCYCK